MRKQAEKTKEMNSRQKRKTPFSVSIIPTQLQIRAPLDSPKKRKKSTLYLRDGDFPGKVTFRQFMHEFLLEFKRHPSMVADTFSGFCVDRLEPAAWTKSLGTDVLWIYGYVKSGSFGFESELVDIRDSNKRKKRESTDCELIPFFFLLDFETGKDSAILLTEQFGSYSAKGPFLNRLQSYVDRRLPPGHKVETSTIVNEEAVKTMLSKRVRAIRFQFARVASDIADSLGNDEHIVKNGVMELTIRAKSGLFPNIDWNLLQEKKKLGLTISDTTSEEMKVDIKVEGRTKTVNIGNLDSFHTSFPIEDRETVQVNGHPSFEQMVLESKDIIQFCREVLGWKKLPKSVKNTF